MSEPEKPKLEKSLRFLEKTNAQSLETHCARVTAMGRAGQRLAHGELYGDPSVTQIQSGRFWPDDAARLGTLETATYYLSFDWLHLLPVKVTGVCREEADGHISFEVTGPAVRFHHSQARG